MVREMLARKSEKHAGYNLQAFERELAGRYRVEDSAPLKQGERKIYYCTPV